MLLEYRSADAAAGILSPGFNFSSGHLIVYNALDENGITTEPVHPDLRVHHL